jgi:hypothetical protein
VAQGSVVVAVLPVPGPVAPRVLVQAGRPLEWVEVPRRGPLASLLVVSWPQSPLSPTALVRD